jgi:hypothetical protein
MQQDGAMIRGLFESSFAIYLIVVVGGIALIVWSLVLWIRVATRWLRLHPAPRRNQPTTPPDRP